MTEFNLDELAKLSGQEFVYNVRGAKFAVKAINVRIRYGNLDLLVKPVAGTGAFWVSRSTLENVTSDTLLNEVAQAC